MLVNGIMSSIRELKYNKKWHSKEITAQIQAEKMESSKSKEPIYWEYLKENVGGTNYTATVLLENGMCIQGFDKKGNKTSDVRFDTDGRVKFCDTLDKRGNVVRLVPERKPE